jgi:hypothetical protein
MLKTLCRPTPRAWPPSSPPPAPPAPRLTAPRWAAAPGPACARPARWAGGVGGGGRGHVLRHLWLWDGGGAVSAATQMQPAHRARFELPARSPASSACLLAQPASSPSSPASSPPFLLSSQQGDCTTEDPYIDYDGSLRCMFEDSGERLGLNGCCAVRRAPAEPLLLPGSCSASARLSARQDRAIPPRTASTPVACSTRPPCSSPLPSLQATCPSPSTRRCWRLSATAPTPSPGPVPR